MKLNRRPTGPRGKNIPQGERATAQAAAAVDVAFMPDKSSEVQ